MSIRGKDILEAFTFRHACKKYDAGKKLSEDDFATILEAGRLSPSSFGFEPWKFLVVESKTLKDRLAPIAWGARNSFAGADRFVIILARKAIDTRFDAAYITHIMQDVKGMTAEGQDQVRQRFGNFQKNDFRLLENDRALFDWAGKQTYIALANMMTAAALLKIDSCPIEGFDRDGVDAVLSQQRVLDPKHFGVSVMVSFGYRGEPVRHAKTRQSMNEVVQIVR